MSAAVTQWVDAHPDIVAGAVSLGILCFGCLVVVRAFQHALGSDEQ